MNGTTNPATNDNHRYDLLAHRHRPANVDKFVCHPEQARRLKQWVSDFVTASNDPTIGTNGNGIGDYDDDSLDEFYEYASDNGSPEKGKLNLGLVNKCALVTGPPGVGKTSLVYTVAAELGMHVIEAHSSERRDAKLFGTLRLANQKQKINPIMKMFQNTIQKQQSSIVAKRKRRKLEEVNQSPPMQQANQTNLSLSGSRSIVLFDDADVMFEDDGPFLKSLVEFIKETKRPVVLTATTSIDQIRNALIVFEHIHLNKPAVDDCAKLLRDICQSEKLYKLGKIPRCRELAHKFDCDIRQCLNRIQFYQERADQLSDLEPSLPLLNPDFAKLTPFIHDGVDEDDDDATDIEDNAEELIVVPDANNRSILSCYDSATIVDLMESRLNLADRLTLKRRWMMGKPSFRNEEHTSSHELGEQIRDSIVDLTQELYGQTLMSDKSLAEHEQFRSTSRGKFNHMSERINVKLQSRIEPPESEFYVDIVPQVCVMTQIDEERLKPPPPPKDPSDAVHLAPRRARKRVSYLDSIAVYLEPSEIKTITETMLPPQYDAV